MNKDAKLNELIRLKKTPAPPIERWQMMPTKQTMTRIASPLRCTSNVPLAKTPDRSRLAVKYKKTPKVKSPTSYKTPNQKVPASLTQSSLKRRSPPKSSAKKKTPGRHTPGNCRFIPNRATTDMEYSSFLVRQNGHRECDDDVSPGTEAYRDSLMQALSHGKRKQKGVLSFRSTPAQRGILCVCSACVMWGVSHIHTHLWECKPFFNAGTNTSYSSVGSSALHSSNRRSMKKTARRLINRADKVMDAPYINNDYCEYHNF